MAQDFDTLSYSRSVEGWPSFYSYGADYMVGMNGYFYSFSGGQLYRHNTNQNRNEYYGVPGNLAPSTITSVFNAEPTTIKLFKTMSYESDDSWTCSSLTTDLGSGSMLNTFFEQKEGEWFTFLRENATTINFKSRSSNGIGSIWGVSGPVNAVITTFQLDDLGSIISVGDTAYQVVPVTPPGVSGTPVEVGTIIAINRFRATDIATGIVTLPSITIDASAAAGFPAFGNFCLSLKNAVAESHGARGYFMEFTLENDSIEAVELFSVGSSMMKSYP